MARASLRDSQKGGGFQIEGKFEVTDAYFAVHQLPPNSKSGKQSAPFPALVLEGYKLDDGWDRIEGEDAISTFFRAAPNLELFRPGSVQNPDDLDEEVEDLGREVDTKGNALFRSEGKKPFDDSAYIMFINSLEKPGGFKPSELDKGVTNVFVGMKLEFKHADMKSYEDKETHQMVTPTTSVCAGAIHTYPYEGKKGGKPATAAKPGTAGGGKVVGKVAVTGKTVTAPATTATTTQTSAPANTDDLGGIAANTIEAHKDLILKACPVNTPVKVTTLRTKLQMVMQMDKLEKETVKAVVEFLKDDDNMMELAVAANFLYDTEAGTVTFQE